MAAVTAPVPDQSGRTALVTGASGGIGLWTALGLVRAGALVTISGRSAERTREAAAWIARQSGRPAPATELADFASLRAVRDLGQRIAARHPRLDLLINNAGLMALKRKVSQDGYELTLAVNHLAPFLLTATVLPSLRAAAPARIVTLASTAHTRGRIDFDDLMSTRGYSPIRAYAQSKLANILFTTELARRLSGTGVVANSVHPGVVGSGFGNWGGLAGLGWRLAKPFLLTPEQGASTTLHVATDPALATVSGRYFARSRETATAQAARDTAAAERLWRDSEALVEAALR